MHSVTAGIRKSRSTVRPIGQSLQAQGLGWDAVRTKAANVLGNGRRCFRCNDAMHLERLGPLWLMEIMRTGSSGFAANYHAVRWTVRCVKAFPRPVPTRLIDANSG